jgi:hypothetical protein
MRRTGCVLISISTTLPSKIARLDGFELTVGQLDIGPPKRNYLANQLTRLQAPQQTTAAKVAAVPSEQG